jgi:hypothetical protein
MGQLCKALQTGGCHAGAVLCRCLTRTLMGMLRHRSGQHPLATWDPMARQSSSMCSSESYNLGYKVTDNQRVCLATQLASQLVGYKAMALSLVHSTSTSTDVLGPATLLVQPCGPSAVRHRQAGCCRVGQRVSGAIRACARHADLTTAQRTQCWQGSNTRNSTLGDQRPDAICIAFAGSHSCAH